MATVYRTPGIYVEEVSSGPRPIEGVGTSTAAFVGCAPDKGARLHEPIPIRDPSHFERVFGTVSEDDEPNTLTEAVYGFYRNGGRRCYVVNVGDDSIAAVGRKGLGALETVDEVAIVAAPGYSDAESFEALLSHCEKLADRFAILDPSAEVPEDVVQSLTKVAEVAVPRPSAPPSPSLPRPGAPPSGGPGGSGGSSAGGDPPRPTRPAAPAGPIGMRPRTSDSGYGAFYFPRIVVRSTNGRIVSIPPSGHLAGIYARTDVERGVHKAPANESIRGALNVTYRCTREEQAELNSNGVNCIRFFPRQGIRVWGARTLADSASEWRYIPVRRLFNFVEESIANGTRWVVFEPNDRELWSSIVRDISAFLYPLWRDGALMGNSPGEAFFVKCDAETNPPEVVNAGQVVCLIGIAPVKPAEFVVFRIGQHAGGTNVSVGG